MLQKHEISEWSESQTGIKTVILVEIKWSVDNGSMINSHSRWSKIASWRKIEKKIAGGEFGQN